MNRSLRGDVHTHFVTQNVNLTFLGWWVGKTIFAMEFCVTKWFQRRSHFKRKNINKYKKIQYTHVCFPFHTVATYEVLVLDGFLNSAFVISPPKKAPNSNFHSSQQVQNGRERNYVIRVYSFRNHILTFIEVPADTCGFVHIY